MKKLFLLAAATFGMLLSTSCNKESNDTSIDKVNVSLKVNITKDILSLGTAKVVLGDNTLKAFSGADTSYSGVVNIDKFPYQNTLKLVFTRDASKQIEKGKMYNLKWGSSYEGAYILKNGEQTKISDMSRTRAGGEATNISASIELFYTTPVEILEINLKEDGTYVPAN